MSKKDFYYWTAALDLQDLSFDDLASSDKYRVSETQRMMKISQEESINRMREIIQFRRDKLYHKCFVCGFPSKKKCQVCLGIYYCSKKCQKEDWKDHKPCCSPDSSEELEQITLDPDD